MKENAPYFRLRPYVALVKGAARCALYDLHNRRIFPIPQAAGYVLECCERSTIGEVLAGINDPADRATAQEYLDELDRREFGRFHEDTSTLLPFNAALPEYKLSQLHWLSIDLRGEHGPGDPDWVGLISRARSVHGCRQLTVFLGGEATGERFEVPVLEFASGLRFHQIELVFPGTSVSESWEALAVSHSFRIALTAKADYRNATFQRLNGSGIMTRFVQPDTQAAITERSFVCDHEAFRRLRNSSVHCNSLHINPAGQVFPWVLEEHHLIGVATDGDALSRLMRSAELRQAWTFSKDLVEQCRDCEFRYACPHSYTFREYPERVGSRPAKCDYDPYAARWRQSKTDLFNESNCDDIDRSSTAYFEISAFKRKPLPPGYDALLDNMVLCAAECFGLPLPNKRIRYLYYPGMPELQQDVRLRYGGHVSGLTELEGGPNSVVIRTAYPGHVHEVLHALLLAVNPDPVFFVSEACATLLGTCWGTDKDLAEEATLSQQEVRVVGKDGEDVAIDHCLIFDDKGLLYGPLRRNKSIHDIARVLVQDNAFTPRVHSWFEATNESSLPGCFYQLGGSFFLWLIESHGKRRFLDFYQSKQTARHLEEYYRSTIDSLEGGWLAFLKGISA